MKNYELSGSHKAAVLFEISVEIEEYSYLIIYGTHINGYYCCIPNKKWGCEMSSPEEIGYNADKLIECGTEPHIAEILAKAIYDYNNHI